ncbi:25S rRNA (adenine645-N1)-methyltransferase [Actinomortierella wolfii]|nr:25S rRNA (adenine645-N1)-methyltransferase [Actinomortierella wolfii]
MFAVPGFNVGELVVQPAKEQIKKRKHEEKAAAAKASTAETPSTTAAKSDDSPAPPSKKQKKEQHPVTTKADSTNANKKDAKNVHKESSAQDKDKKKQQQHKKDAGGKDSKKGDHAEAEENDGDESAVMLKNRASWNRSTKELRKAKLAEKQAELLKKKKEQQQQKMNKDDAEDDGGSNKRNKRLERKLKRAMFMMKQAAAVDGAEGSSEQQEIRDLTGVPIPEEVSKTLTKKELKMLKDLIKATAQGKDSAEVVKAVATGKKASSVPTTGTVTATTTTPAAIVAESVLSGATEAVDAETRKQQLAQERQKLLEALARMDSALEVLEGSIKDSKPAAQEKKSEKVEVKKDAKKQQQQQATEAKKDDKKQEGKKEQTTKDDKKKKEAKAETPSAPAKPVAKPEPIPQPKLTKLQEQMKKKLAGGKFRFLNEQLYTTTGAEAFELFQAKPELFDEYHEGFRAQVELWPTNPVDVFIEQLKKLPKDTVIADLGCGDATIGATLTKQKVLSFDLVAKNDRVTACDIAHLPLTDASVDVAVFCLSLMGTDFIKFLKEAHRVLKPNGQLKIAEVVSRFTDVDAFVAALTKLGFDLVRSDDSNKMFITFDFVKAGAAGGKKNKKNKKKAGAADSDAMDVDDVDGTALLKPCIYKKR